MLGLLAAGVTVSDAWRRRRHHHAGALLEAKITRTTWRDELVLLTPPIAVFVLVSSQTGFNHHLRYVLPAFPFLFIWISKVGRVFERQRVEGREQRADTENSTGRASGTRNWGTRLMQCAVAGAVGWSVVSSFAAYPHSLSYFNELVGGPKGGHWHLGSSNVDWGQDLMFLKDWYEEHPEARPLHLAYDLILVDPSIVGIEYKQVSAGPVMNRPSTPKTANWPWGEVPADPNLPAVDSAVDPKELGPFPGWYCLSVNQIHRLAGDYEYFLEFEPVDWIGYSMMVFNITLEEANRVRRKLGLPELGANDE